MKRHALIFALSVLTFASQEGCGSDHLLVGERSGSDAGDNTEVQGGGGSGGAPSGSGGATVTRSERPLQITGREALTRMAALIWSAAPDGDLLSQDSSGHFKTVEDLYGPARQMLADPRAAQGVGAFYRWWLNLGTLATTTKDPQLFPQFNAQMATDMGNEIETFGVNVTLTLSGSYQTLMTAPFSFINARLADVYGVAGVTGDNLRQVSLNPQERAGLLTLPGMQALSSQPTRPSPTIRGRNVRQQILCQAIPDPPPSVSALVPPDPAGVSVRQRLLVHEVDAACASCHSLIDWLGLAFEGFDAIGHTRTVDNGAPIDVSLLLFDDRVKPTTSFNGPIELANLLAGDDVAEQCMAHQWLAFALHKSDFFSNSSEAVVNTAMAQIMAPFRASNFNLKELIAGVVLTDAFLAPTQP